MHAVHEAKSAQVRSRIKFIEEGERNTKYLLNFEKARANAKVMDMLKTQDGRILENHESILNEQIDFYRKVYKQTRTFDKCLAENFLHGTDVPQIKEDDRKKK